MNFAINFFEPYLCTVVSSDTRVMAWNISLKKVEGKMVIKNFFKIGEREEITFIF